MAMRHLVNKSTISKVGSLMQTQSSVISNQQRFFHVAKHQKQESTVIFGLLGIAVAAYGGAMVAESVGNYIAKRDEGKQAAGASTSTDKTTASGTAEDATNKSQSQSQSQQQQDQQATSSKGFFSSFFQTGYYEGGFEETMSRREAALVLGIRESSPKEKVIQAHRKLSLINHPDKGGSPYIAQKVNEAKEVLLGARR